MMGTSVRTVSLDLKVIGGVARQGHAWPVLS